MGGWSSSGSPRRPRTTTIAIPTITAGRGIMGTEPQLSWNLAHDLSEILEYHFMVNALLAASVVAVMAGLLGWLMVLRKETFAGHTLSMMAFPGAAGAALIGVPAMWGYFVFCGAGAAAIGGLSGGRQRSWSEQ